MASSTSSSSADLPPKMPSQAVAPGVVGSLMSVLSLPGAGARVLQRHPAHQRALDPGRVLGDTGEGDGVLELVLELLGHRRVALALHLRHEVLAGLQRLG